MADSCFEDRSGGKGSSAFLSAEVHAEYIKKLADLVPAMERRWINLKLDTLKVILGLAPILRPIDATEFEFRQLEDALRDFTRSRYGN